MSESAPESKSEAIASGLGLAALRTLIERYGDDYDGVPGVEREEFAEGREEQVETALRKGVIYETGEGLLFATADERLAAAADYKTAREAARRTAAERGHELASDRLPCPPARMDDGETRGNGGPARPDVLGLSHDQFTDCVAVGVGSLLACSLIWTLVYYLGGVEEGLTFGAGFAVYAMLVTLVGEFLRLRAERRAE